MTPVDSRGLPPLPPRPPGAPSPEPPRHDEPDRPPIDIQAVQRLRKVTILGGGLLLAATTLTVTFIPVLEHAVEHVGLIAIMVCIIGRSWCSLYIGGRKKQEIVSSGPYSISRNPLYVFSFIGAFGIGCQTGSVTVGAIFALAAWMVFRLVVSREEAFLTDGFGAPYRSYVARTPRFLPNPRLWRDESELTIRPAFFVRTVLDGLVFLLALPLFEALERLQHLGLVRVLLRLP